MEEFMSYEDFCEFVDIPYDYSNNMFDDSTKVDESKDAAA